MSLIGDGKEKPSRVDLRLVRDQREAAGPGQSRLMLRLADMDGGDFHRRRLDRQRDVV